MDINKLEFELVVVPEVFGYIPPHLLEQIYGRSWSVERFFKYGPASVLSHFNRFWVLKDVGNAIKGVLFATIDVLSEKLNVVIFSVDEEYHKGSLKFALDFLRQFIAEFNELEVDIKLNEKINWVTAQPEMFDELGGKQPKTVLIEV